MKARCKNPKNPIYPFYGGRGIKVCERWHRFDNFFEDMGERPAKLSLERIKNDGDYEPGNVVWANAKKQARNRRNTLEVAHGGKMIPLAEFCEIHGLRYEASRVRLKKGSDLFAPYRY